MNNEDFDAQLARLHETNRRLIKFNNALNAPKPPVMAIKVKPIEVMPPRSKLTKVLARHNDRESFAQAAVYFIIGASAVGAGLMFALGYGWLQ